MNPDNEDVFPQSCAMTTPITETVFDCDKCSAKFLHRYSLTRHMLTHSDIRFKCGICHALFKYKTNLKRHERNTHKIPRKNGPRSMYSITPHGAGPLPARNWIDLTKDSDDEDDLSDVRCGQRAALNKVTQGDDTFTPSNINSLKSERIDLKNTEAYTCNLNEPGSNSNVCLCGYCTVVDIKFETENDNNMHIKCPPTSRNVVSRSTAGDMTIESDSLIVKSDRKYKKCDISNNKPLSLSDLDSHRFPEERYKMAKEYIIEQHKKINSYERTIRELENCIGIMNDELIRYKTKYKNEEANN